MLHGARHRGDRDQALEIWQRIVLSELERVRGIVRAYRHEQLPQQRVRDADVDDVVSTVYLRLHGRVDTLRGEHVGELRNFMRTAAGYACLDYLHGVVREEQRRAGSLDATGEERGAVAGNSLERFALEAFEAGDAADRASEVIHAGLAMVDDDKRAVLVMQAAGCSMLEIQQRLHLSRDAVYQRRRRGLLQLGDAVRGLTEEDREDG